MSGLETVFPMPPAPYGLDRRQILRTLAVAGGAALAAACSGEEDVRDISDVSQVESFRASRVLRPRGTRAVQAALGDSTGAVSIGGARFSMGGQIVSPRSLHLDMRGMDRLVWIDPGQRRARVQAGMCWRDLQDHLDPHELAVKVMQSYSNFSIGGSVSVNCHGRYVGAGPVANTVRALQLVSAAGQVIELSRESNPDLFGAVMGGYGGLGVLTEIELDLAENGVLERRVEHVSLDDYPAFFRERVLRDGSAVMHNADLAPPFFDRPLAITWARTDAPLTHAQRLVPRDVDYSADRNLIWTASELPYRGLLREHLADAKLLREPRVVHRNHEASLDTDSLEPRTRLVSTYLLQEYFIPVAGFAVFAQAMARILREHAANALNVSIRHSPADATSLLRWADDEVFSFVVYHKQRNTVGADAAAGQWARRLIDVALDLGGRYYLPYRPHATPAQFRRAYPEVDSFAAIKLSVDPERRFRNRLWDKYLPPR